MQCKLVRMRDPVVKARDLLSSGLMIGGSRQGDIDTIQMEEVGSAYMYQSVGRRSK